MPTISIYLEDKPTINPPRYLIPIRRDVENGGIAPSPASSRCYDDERTLEPHRGATSAKLQHHRAPPPHARIKSREREEKEPAKELLSASLYAAKQPESSCSPIRRNVPIPMLTPALASPLSPFCVYFAQTRLGLVPTPSRRVDKPQKAEHQGYYILS
uniref:Uncharacterized protein n=1 Tax=Ananas comosus var. bracteatus TaxID=296719 RepID=A0A6V7QF99_ANACO|nr:unnamed protein product [Ananas comosus var. bracteatus]